MLRIKRIEKCVNLDVALWKQKAEIDFTTKNENKVKFMKRVRKSTLQEN